MATVFSFRAEQSSGFCNLLCKTKVYKIKKIMKTTSLKTFIKTDWVIE